MVVYRPEFFLGLKELYTNSRIILFRDVEAARNMFEVQRQVAATGCMLFGPEAQAIVSRENPTRILGYSTPSFDGVGIELVDERTSLVDMVEWQRVLRALLGQLHEAKMGAGLIHGSLDSVVMFCSELWCQVQMQRGARLAPDQCNTPLDPDVRGLFRALYSRAAGRSVDAFGHQAALLVRREHAELAQQYMNVHYLVTGEWVPFQVAGAHVDPSESGTVRGTIENVWNPYWILQHEFFYTVAT